MFNFAKKDELDIVNVNDLDNIIGKIELIDIREPYEYKNGSLKSAKNIPMGDLLNETEKYLSKETTYYIMCQSGARSKRTSRALAGNGYHVINVSGGVGSYVGTKRK
ncbi:MAG: rhodanese-like domain-containing protein [Firmicutes bacterium HGW-Firmicutes-16]|nr:MAG: rhodanese-like domain-containing protein [Firmicutes bacterium HGW-Firmicutes-16]